MSCEHNWTIRFPRTNGSNPDFEVRPVSMSLKRNRVGYDFFRAKLPWEVGEQMKPHTSQVEGVLRGYRPVEVLYNGEVIHQLLFRPDWVDYGSSFTHLQLHDLRESLSDGNVDEQHRDVKLRDIYRNVFEESNNGIIEDIEFRLPEGQATTLLGTGSDGFGPGLGSKELAESDAELQSGVEVAEGSHAVDFDNVTPEEALAELNRKFSLNAWVNADRVLVIGYPELTGVGHLAAPDDNRVWRYKDAEISHGREPIKRVIVNGAWVDEKGLDLDFPAWFNEGGTGDVRVQGVAVREDIEFGKTINLGSSEAKKESVGGIAEAELRKRIQDKNNGTVEIDPELSGDEFSRPVDLSPGDFLQLVPDDGFFGGEPDARAGSIATGQQPEPSRVCGEYVNNETYVVAETEHNLTDGGDYIIHANIGMHYDSPVRTYTRYFDPTNDEFITDDRVENKSKLFENVSAAWWDSNIL